MHLHFIPTYSSWLNQWSPDGQEVVFYAYRGGNRDIWVMPLGGGAPRQLTTNPADDMYPSWAPDGASVVYSAPDGIWTVSSQGGESRQIVAGSTGTGGPAWSPDGRRLVFNATRGGPQVVWHVSRDGGEPEPLGHIQTISDPVWSRDGQEIFHLGLVDGTPHLWALPAEGGTERQLTDLQSRRGQFNGNALATDGEYLYFVWQVDSTDIWVMDVVQDDGSDN